MSFDGLFEKTARHVGTRVTRRSILGRTAATLTTIGVGGLGFSPSSALAADSCGCRICGDSTSCGGSFGHNCPRGTCPGGAWYGCTTFCGNNVTVYRDCMPTGSCGFYCGKDGRPGCYYSTPYGSCGGRTLVWCRAVYCVGPDNCR